MKRLALLLSLLLVAGACSDGGGDEAAQARRRPPEFSPGEPVPTASPFPSPKPGRSISRTTASWVDGLPPLIVSHGSDVRRHHNRRTTLMTTVDGTANIAFAAGAATVLVERGYAKTRSEIMRARRGSFPRAIDLGKAHEIRLLDVAVIGGVRKMLFTTYYPPSESEVTGYLYMQDVPEGNRSRITEANGPEYGVTRASYGGDAIVTSAWSDLTEVFQFFDANGKQLEERPTPTEELNYGARPYMSDAVLSPDGKLLAYLEGPDWDQESQDLRGDWVLVLLDEPSGKERWRVKIADRSICVPWLDFDGRWLVISRTRWKSNDICESSAGRALNVAVVDSADPSEMVELENIAGVATIDD